MKEKEIIYRSLVHYLELLKQTYEATKNEELIELIDKTKKIMNKYEGE